MATKRAAIGPRVTVAVGSRKVGNQTQILYSYMPKTVADLFGFKPAPNAKAKDRTVSGKKITGGLIRGSFGAGAIKVPVGKPTKKKNAAGKAVSVQKYRSIPMPGGMTNTMISTFLKKASKNKPTSFVSRDGRSYPVSTAK